MWRYFLIISIFQLLHAQEIALIGKNAIQSDTWANLGANLAIDGNVLTYSVAASQGNPNALGWWEVDLGGNYQVGRVVITASDDNTNSRYLHNFDIWLLKEDRSEKLCFKYTSVEHVPAGETKSFNCEPGTFPTRYIRISRTSDSYRQDALALAEVRAYTGSLSIVEERPVEVEIGGYEIPLAGLQTAQSTTWGQHVSSLAIDNDKSTFSISCILCDGSLNAGVGWWHIDLERERNVAGVKITTSPDLYNAQYLKDFVVALTHENTTDMSFASLCHDYSSPEEMEVLKTLSLKCSQPTMGRYLIVRRKEISQFRPDAIAIADIKIFELPNSK